MRIPRFILTLVNLGVVIFLGSFLSCGHSPAVKEGDLFAGMSEENKEGQTTETKPETSTLDEVAQSGQGSEGSPGSQTPKNEPQLLDATSELDKLPKEAAPGPVLVDPVRNAELNIPTL